MKIPCALLSSSFFGFLWRYSVPWDKSNRKSPSAMATRTAKKQPQPQIPSGKITRRGPGQLSVTEKSFDAVEVFFGVDAYGVEGVGFDVDCDVVFEEAELFEALGLLEG